jgi:hypothetical protein
METWVIKVKKALGDGREDYERAANLIVSAMLSNSLSQKEIATKIDRSPTWVCRLWAWHKKGCPTETVFGPEIASRRVIAIATSQSKKCLTGSAECWGQLDLFGGRSDYEPGENAAATKMATTIGMCRQYITQLEALSRDDLNLAFQSAPMDRREYLQKLCRALEKSISSGEIALDEARAALKPPSRQIRLVAAA